MTSKPQRVAVIGAGIMGLTVLRRLSEDKKFQLVCFERNYDVGGLWLYTDQTTESDFGKPITSAVYSNLRSNTPKQLLEVNGFPTDSLQSFPTHKDILAYIKMIVDRSGLRQYIKFCTEVKEVKPVNPKDTNTTWQVTYGDIRVKSDTHTDEFDAVIVGSGNCSVPNYPVVEDEDKFGGRIIHSIQYRHPELYSGHTVAILGQSYSAIDIAVDISKQANQVYLCHRGKPLTTELTEKVTEKSSTFKKFTEKSVILEDGEELHIDAVVYCTGYKYDLSFLPKGLIKIGEGNLVSNMYQSVLSVEYSTLLFTGLPREVPFFVTSDYQALFIRAVLKGTAKLPAIGKIRDMVSHGKSCAIDKTSWLDWINELAEMAGCEKPRIGKALFDVWNHHFGLWCSDWPNCWALTYKINGPDSYIVQ